MYFSDVAIYQVGYVTNSPGSRRLMGRSSEKPRFDPLASVSTFGEVDSLYVATFHSVDRLSGWSQTVATVCVRIVFA